jgi:hypothetical protein
MGKGVEETLLRSNWFVVANVCAIAIDESKRVVGWNFSRQSVGITAVYNDVYGYCTYHWAICGEFYSYF